MPGWCQWCHKKLRKWSATACEECPSPQQIEAGKADVQKGWSTADRRARIEGTCDE